MNIDSRFVRKVYCDCHAVLMLQWFSLWIGFKNVFFNNIFVYRRAAVNTIVSSMGGGVFSVILWLVCDLLIYF